ncbi:MAG TPA: hypothetical protein VMH28_33435 [Candidatus Acidoferrales bacterium]|nr:hypothetical protein [Candidatus Acidoferrales bacterium]
MKCEHPSAELLLRRLDAEVPPDELAALDEHMADCGECKQQYDKLRAVSVAIGEYSAGLLEPPPAGQRRTLVAAIDGRAAARRKSTYATLAVAASVILTAAAVFLMPKGPAPEPPAADVAAGAFVALPYSTVNLSAEGAVVLQVEVPRSAVALAGMPVNNGPADGRVKAEVLVGADGLARAIRFLN